MEMKDRIRQLMDDQNLSQQEFAQRLNLSAASLSSIFTGRTNPTNKHVLAIHHAFYLVKGISLMMLQFYLLPPNNKK